MINVLKANGRNVSEKDVVEIAGLAENVIKAAKDTLNGLNLQGLMAK